MKTVRVKHVSDVVGEWGSWQRNITLFALTSNLFSAFNNLALSFYAPHISFWCADNQTLPNQTVHSPEKSVEELCRSGCKKWQYDNSVFSSTIIQEWDLVCEWANLASLTHSLYMIGYAIAAVIVGYLSDRYGRLPLLWISTVIEILAGVSSAFSLSITHFTISRIFLAFGSNGRLLSCFMLVSETVGPNYRAKIGIYTLCGWASGYCLLPGIVYLLPNFRHFILATTLPEILWLLWLWTLPESPRWQIIKGQYKKAENELIKAMTKNKVSIEEIQEKCDALKKNIEFEQEQMKIERKANLLDLMKNRKLRKYTLIMYFTWFVNAFVYYGISLNIEDFGGNLFLSFFIAGAIEFPCYFFSAFIFRYLGRRPFTAVMMYGAGLSCLGTIPFVNNSLDSVRIAIAMIGKFCVTCSYGIIYIYAAEIYPTILRQTGVGSCSIAARFGSILAPFVKQLTDYTSFGVVLSIFGGLSLINGISVHFLPETRGIQVPDTLREAEEL